MMRSDLLALLTGPLGLRAGACAGKVVVITGAGQGIGLQAARAFALLGGRVVIAEISPQGAEAEALIRAEGGQALYIHTDVSDSASVRSLYDQSMRACGPADVLINNAIRCPSVPLAEMDISLWDEVIAVNLRGTFLTCKAFLPDMLALKRGVILNLVSTEAMPGLSAYIASKQGIAGFTQSLALEVTGSGVQVIPFGPGMVDTPGIRAISADLAPRLGLTQETFLGMSLHPAYDGLMPAAHAGAAAALLALRFAPEYHGQPVTGYEILERAGFLQVTAPAALASPPFQPAAAPSGHSPAELSPLLERLAQVLVETGKEFEKLPVFVRPIARQGFKGKAGAGLEDWQRALVTWKDNPASPPSGITARLDKLAAYYRGVPAETARFTRDADLLRQVQEICDQRLALIEEIKAGIG